MKLRFEAENRLEKAGLRNKTESRFSGFERKINIEKRAVCFITDGPLRYGKEVVDKCLGNADMADPVKQLVKVVVTCVRQPPGHTVIDLNAGIAQRKCK